MNGVIKIHANGKLLITGEYLVLAGAKALALPVRFGQTMQVEESEGKYISWESYTFRQQWFEAKFDPTTFHVIHADNHTIATRLKNLLTAAHGLNPEFPVIYSGCKVSVSANYPVEWGLGSSATLIYLVARWAGVDPYELNRLVAMGSGYDIACAGKKELLFYRLDNGHADISIAHAGQALCENTWFTYLGNKQDSDGEIRLFLGDKNFSDKEVAQVSRLSSFICQAAIPDELISLVDEHESILGKILKREPIALRFPGFPGTVKSLGAWGGDFAMFISASEPGEVVGFLHQHGFPDVFSFHELEATR